MMKRFQKKFQLVVKCSIYSIHLILWPTGLFIYYFQPCLNCYEYYIYYMSSMSGHMIVQQQCYLTSEVTCITSFLLFVCFPFMIHKEQFPSAFSVFPFKQFKVSLAPNGRSILELAQLNLACIFPNQVNTTVDLVSAFQLLSLILLIPKICLAALSLILIHLYYLCSKITVM